MKIKQKHHTVHLYKLNFTYFNIDTNNFEFVKRGFKEKYSFCVKLYEILNNKFRNKLKNYFFDNEWLEENKEYFNNDEYWFLKSINDNVNNKNLGLVSTGMNRLKDLIKFDMPLVQVSEEYDDTPYFNYLNLQKLIYEMPFKDFLELTNFEKLRLVESLTLLSLGDARKLTLNISEPEKYKTLAEFIKDKTSIRIK